MARTSKLPASLPPRGLSEDQSAELWGVCRNTFKKLVKLGIASGPIDIGGDDALVLLEPLPVACIPTPSPFTRGWWTTAARA